MYWVRTWSLGAGRGVGGRVSSGLTQPGGVSTASQEQPCLAPAAPAPFILPKTPVVEEYGKGAGQQGPALSTS